MPEDVPPTDKDTARSHWFDPVVMLATGLGFGFSRIMPGTVGAIWGVPLAWGIAQIELVSSSGPQTVGIQLAVIAVLCLLGIPLCTEATRRLGLGKDPGSIVWDEIASMPITFFLVPVATMDNPWVLLAGFLLHRVFDISKPPPCRQLERLKDGLGIMADDWVAGLYSCGVLHLGLWFFQVY